MYSPPPQPRNSVWGYPYWRGSYNGFHLTGLLFPDVPLFANLSIRVVSISSNLYPGTTKQRVQIGPTNRAVQTTSTVTELLVEAFPYATRGG